MSSRPAERALEGVRIVVTRAAQQAAGLKAAFEALGAEVIVASMIRIVPPEDTTEVEEALANQARYDAVLIGSVNAVETVKGLGRALDRPVVAVGRKTKKALEPIARTVWVPRQSNAEGMVAHLVRRFGSDLSGRRFLFLRAPEGRETAVELLETAGAAVDPVTAYRIADEAVDPDTSARLATADVFTFMSGETLAAFLRVVPEGAGLLARGTVAVIGPIAAKRAGDLGVRVDVVPEETSAEALVEAIIRSCAT